MSPRRSRALPRAEPRAGGARGSCSRPRLAAVGDVPQHIATQARSPDPLLAGATAIGGIVSRAVARRGIAAAVAWGVGAAVAITVISARDRRAEGQAGERRAGVVAAAVAAIVVATASVPAAITPAVVAAAVPAAAVAATILDAAAGPLTASGDGTASRDRAASMLVVVVGHRRSGRGEHRARDRHSDHACVQVFIHINLRFHENGTYNYPLRSIFFGFDYQYFAWFEPEMNGFGVIGGVCIFWACIIIRRKLSTRGAARRG